MRLCDACELTAVSSCPFQVLRTMLNNASSSSLLLLEDIDAAFSQKRAAANSQQKLTFSGRDPDQTLTFDLDPGSR